MARCERCGYELSAEAEKLLAELRVELARSDPAARVQLNWGEGVRNPLSKPRDKTTDSATDFPGRYPTGFARNSNEGSPRAPGTEPPAA
jgi:hypothetical protein